MASVSKFVVAVISFIENCWKKSFPWWRIFFTLTHSTVNGNAKFCSRDTSRTRASVKYSENAKFENRLLVSACASEKGMTRPYFVSSGLAVNQFLIRTDFFLEKTYSIYQYLSFWWSKAVFVWLGFVEPRKNRDQSLRGRMQQFCSQTRQSSKCPRRPDFEVFWKARCTWTIGRRKISKNSNLV